MATLTRDQILKADDLKSEKVSVPEWGGEVLVRHITGSERDAFESAIMMGEGDSRKVNQKDLRAKLCALCIVGEDGKRLFEDSQIAELGKKNAIALNRVFEVAQRMNGMGGESVAEAKKL